MSVYSVRWFLFLRRAQYVCVSRFFFSSRRRHTRCALVTGVQTCALPILAATMRSLAQDLLRETVKRLKAAETPEQRIDAVILANFSDAQNEPENVSAWLAFWAEARTAPALWRKIGRAHV